MSVEDTDPMYAEVGDIPDDNNMLDEMTDAVVLTGIGDMYTKHGADQAIFLMKVGNDEPIFILRARDPLSVNTIEFWISYAATQGVNAEKIAEAQDHLQAFRNWQETHSTKVPD